MHEILLHITLLLTAFASLATAVLALLRTVQNSERIKTINGGRNGGPPSTPAANGSPTPPQANGSSTPSGH